MPNSTYTGTRLFFLHIGEKTTDHGSVMTCKTDGTDLQTLVSGLGSHPDGVVVDLVDQHIYYTNMGEDPAKNDGFITRLNLDGSNAVDIIPKGITFTPKQCTIEPESRKLYWCDREGMKVWRADLDGSHPEVIYAAAEGEEARQDQRNHCVGITVDAAKGKFWWTQKGPPKGDVGRLFSANIDMPRDERPTNRSDVRVLQENLPEPIDLEMDHAGQVLYKTDRGSEPRGNTVSRLHLDKGGRVVEEILVSHLNEAIGLALDLRADRMYFTDIGGSVYSAKLDGSDKKVILEDIGDLTGIVCVHFD